MFDQNLAPRLMLRLADLYPDSTHVWYVALSQASDLDIWQFALEHDYIIVTKDADYSELSALRGTPPKVIWLRIGNCPARQIETILRRHYSRIETFARDPDAGVFSLL